MKGEGRRRREREGENEGEREGGERGKGEKEQRVGVYRKINKVIKHELLPGMTS